MAGNRQSAGNKFQQYQQATSQLLSIQQQQKANIAQASSEEAVLQDKNNQLLQSSGYMAQQVAANNVLTQQAALAAQQGGGFNPATVGTLAQYGLGQPKQQKATTRSTSNQQQTKQKVTINNKTENIIYNDVKVPANIGGPIQGRPIQIITDKSKLDGGLGKFKTWLDDTFNKQAEASAKRQREYRRKDADLTKKSNKMVRELDNVSKSLGDRLDPKHVYRDIGSAFKNVLLLIGLGKLAKEWPNLIEKLDNIEKKVKDFFDDRKNRIKGLFSKDGSFSKNLVKIFGGKPGESIGQAFKNLLFDEKEGLIAYIRKYLKDRLEERSAAIKTVKKPNFDLLNISESIGSLGTYLADILAAILNPQSSAGRNMKEYEKQGREAAYSEKKVWGRNRELVLGYDEKGNKIKEHVYDNDRTLVKGEYSGLTKNAVDSKGNLTNHASSYYSQSTFLNSNLKQAENGNINTANVGVGLERLYRAAKENPYGKVPISMDFVQSILSKKEIEELGLKRQQYTYVIRERPAEDIAKELKEKGSRADMVTAILSVAGGFLGSAAGPEGTLSGVGTGVALGEILKEMKLKKVPRYQYELVSPREVKENDIIAGIGQAKNYTLTEETPYVYEASPEVIAKLIEKLTGKTDINIDINDKEYMSAIEAGLMKRNKSGVVNKPIDLDKTYAATDLYNQHRADEKNMWENSRMVSAGEGVSEVASDIGNSVKEKAQNVKEGLGNTRLGKSLFSDRTSATYKREGKSDVSWSDIRINKNDKKTAHAGTGAIGTDNINRNYLASLLEREIGGEFGRKEGNANGVYVNAADGGNQAGHGNYGYGNTYATLKKWYTGPVSFKLADGTIKKFNNLEDADKWFVDYCKKNKTTGISPASKKVVLTDETAKAINNKSLSKFIDDYVVKLDPEIMGAMDEQTLAGLMHIAYGGQGRFMKLVNFYKTHKQESLEDLQSNNGVHTEDFVNRVMMNTPEGSEALHTAWDGHHTDRRGILTGYHTFNYYNTEEDWEKHLALGNPNSGSSTPKQKTQTPTKTQKSTPTPTPTPTPKPNPTQASPPPEQMASGTELNFENYNTLPEVDIVSSPIEVSENKTVEPELDFEKYNVLPEVDVVDYALSSPAINTQTPQTAELKKEDESIYIIPVTNFTEKLVGIDNLLSMMVSTSSSNLEATMNVLDALSAKKAAEDKTIIRETPSFSYIDLDNNGVANNDSNIFQDYGYTNLENTQG